MVNCKTRRESPAVSAGSMADIAFLLLIFFLVTTTIAEEAGVLVKLPPWTEDEEPIVTPNVLTVIVNAEDELLIEDKRAGAGDVAAVLREFVLSPNRTPKQVVVSLVHDRSTSYTRYVEIYDALLAGYHALWDERAERSYGRNYDSLSDRQRRIIRWEIPMIISEAEPNDALGMAF